MSINTLESVGNLLEGTEVKYVVKEGIITFTKNGEVLESCPIRMKGKAFRLAIKLSN
jgi:hypothetical protein